MSLYSSLSQLSSNSHLPCSTLISTNSIAKAFADLSDFIKADLGSDLARYSQNSIVIRPQDSGNINIDQIRQLKNFLYQTSTEQNKVVVILEADCMNINSYNACLKILEEPYGNTYIFLVSDNPSKIIQTVQSRCYKINAHYQEPYSLNEYEYLIDALFKGSFFDVLEKFDLKKHMQSFTFCCLLVISKMVKMRSGCNVQDLMETERLLFEKSTSSVEALLNCYDRVWSLSDKFDKYGLEHKSIAILIFNSIYEHFSN